MIPSSLDLSLSHADANLLIELMDVWRAKRLRNLTRTVYYDGKAMLKDFGISLPPQMRRIESALGWTTKGVNALTDRSVFEGFVSPDNTEDPFDLSGVMSDNRFMVEFPQAKVSSAVHGCSFLTVTNGDVQSGEPDVLVLARAAEDSAAVWDRRRRLIRGFLSVVDAEHGDPTVLVMHTPEKVLTFTKRASSWAVDMVRNPLGFVSVALLAYRPELKRPFGHSRITRASMGYVDSGLRTIVRAEVSSEFYSAPEYWLFGADVEKFVGSDKWTAIMGRIKALDVDVPEDKPDLTRFTGASPQPHTEQLRMWANLFAEDQDLSVTSLGDSPDNPSSADAIFAAKESLITTSKTANTVWGTGAADAMRFAVMLRDGLTEVPDELRRLSAQHTDPSIVSPGAKADSFVKLASAIPGFAESEVGLEMAGLTQEQIIRFQAEKRRATAVDRLTSLVDVARGIRADTPAAVVEPGADANELKAKFDALGVAVRAGVDPTDAAARLGLTGIKFTGATPVALRLPKDDAAELEAR